MSKSKSEKVWLLYHEEFMTTQHTGYDSCRSNLAIFDHKPDVEEIAPMIGEYLDNGNIGRAIAQVVDLLKTGSMVERGFAISLQEIKLNTLLEMKDR